MSLDSGKTDLESVGTSVRLRNCLEKIGIRYAEDVNLALTSLKAGQIRGMGKKTIYELNQLTMRFSNSNSLQSMQFQGNQILEDPDNVTGVTNLLEQLEISLRMWYSLRDNRNEYQVIWRRYGLGGNKESTLEKISYFLGLSRERVRQIEVRDTKRISYLLNGYVDPASVACLPKQIIETLTEVKEMLNGKNFYELSKFKKEYTQQFGYEIEKRHYGMLSLVLHCWNYTLVSKSTPSYIIAKGCISEKQFIILSRAVNEYLKNEPEPVKEFDLITSVKKIVCNKKLQNAHITEYCRSNSFITFGNSGKQTYELNQIHLLKDFIKGFRILRENGDVMHLKDIIREIKRKQFAETGNRGKALASSNVLSKSDLFLPVGKTGMWALTKWNVTSHSLPDLIQEYLEKKGVPISTGELLEFIRSNPGREMIDSNKLSIILHQHRDRFFRTEDKMVTTIRRYFKRRTTIQRMSSKQLYLTIKDLFDQNGIDNMERSLFLEKAKEAGILLVTLHALLKRRSYLVEIERANTTPIVKFHRNSEYVPAKPGAEIRNKIIDKITELLQYAPNKTMLLSELTNKVVRGLGANKPYVYRILDDTPYFIKHYKDDLQMQIVVLSSSRSIKNMESVTSIDDEIMSLIKAGEGLRVEYKSTLRWDLRQQKPNKNLEHEVMKNVCAFANTTGGDLLIGVEDNGNVFGLEYDYKVLGSKKYRDGFLLKISNLLNTLFGNAICALVKVEIGCIEGKDICRIKVHQSPEPVYLENSRIFVRVGSSTRELNPKETVEYIRRKFGNKRG